MAIVRKYKAIVVNVENSLSNIYTVIFSANKKFKFKPGQFLHLALDEYDGVGQWPESRCFSMQSNPNDENLTITFSVVGEFTGRMAKELRQGKEVWLKLPYGDFFQRGHDKNNCVFIAGGTGITPFLSLITDLSFKEYHNPKLYLGFKEKSYNIFDAYLEKAKSINPYFNIEITYENKSGILNIEKIYEENRAKVYFISGPPIMIRTFKNYLLNKNIENENIITDEWE